MATTNTTTPTVPGTMQLTFVVRAYPTLRQHQLFADYLEHTRRLYNDALRERRDAFGWDRCNVKTRKTVGNIEQSRGLTDARKLPCYAAYPRRLDRWAINLVDIAYKGMFARSRKGEKLGVPRFRGRMFWNTIGWDAPVDFTMRERGIFSRKSLGGTLRLRPDRELPPFDDCTAFKLCRDGDRWFAHLTYKMAAKEPKRAAPKRPVGIDVGLIVLTTRSDGVRMDISKQSKGDTADQRRASRALSRCSKRSKRRRKVRERLRRINNRIARRRKAALHKMSARLTHHFDAIAVEDLNLKGLNRGGGTGAKGRGIRKSWRDRAPGQLGEMLKWKGQRDGRPFAAVDPRYTSIACSFCGALVPKSLNDKRRLHECKECGVVLDRDHNAARNICIRAGWGPGDAKPSSLYGRVGLSRKHGKVGRTARRGADAFPGSILPLRGGTGPP